MSTKAQKDKIKKFVGITDCETDKLATSYLKESNWDLERAVDRFFNDDAPVISRGGRQPSKPNSKALMDLFTKYKDETENVISVEGVELFCQDIEVDPSDVVMLAVSYHLKCPKMCEITQDGWISGWTELGVDSIKAMIAAIPALRAELQTPAMFKKIYEFTFMFSREENQRSLPLDTAIALWQLLLKDKFAMLDEWCTFTKEKSGKAVSKDTWNLLLDFCTQVGNDLNQYDHDGAWPTLIDDFVAYMKERQQPKA